MRIGQIETVEGRRRAASYCRQRHMRIVVKLETEAADALDRAAPDHISRAVLSEFLKRWCIELSPMHVGVADKELRTYYKAEIPDSTASDFRRELLKISGVQAAYFKPPDAIP